MSVPQRFLASSVRGAMSEAKRALGPEALIIEHRLVNGRVELLAMPGSSAATAQAAAAVQPEQPAASTAAAQVLPGETDLDLIEEIELALPTVPERPTATATATATASAIAEHSASAAAADVPAAAVGSVVGNASGVEALQTAAAVPDPFRDVRDLRAPASEIGQVLEAMGFSSAILGLLSDQAVTPRLAINELVARCCYSSWPQRSGVLPVIGGGGAGVTTSLLRLALALRSTQPRLRLHAAMSDALAGSEKLLLGAQLLALEGSRLAPDALRAAVAAQVPAELALLDLGLNAYANYAPSLRQLQQQGMLKELVLVVPLHWQPQVYLRELASLDLLWDRSCAVHLIFTGADRSARLGPWLELALRNDWSLGQIGSNGALATPAEPAAPAVLRRLLLPQIDHPEASTIFTEELLRERGA